MKGHQNRSESGVVFLVLLVLIIVGLVFGAFLFVKRAQTKQPMSTTAAEVVEAGGSAISRNAENVQRKNDATIVLSAAAEYASNNQGQLPAMLAGGMLQGMGYYSGASVAQGAQDPVTTDELRLVTVAKCDANGAAVASSSSRQYVVQFALRATDGSFTPQCLAG